MIVDVWHELVSRAKERYGDRLSIPFPERPVFVVDGFRFFLFKQEKAGAVSMWFGDGPIVKGTDVAGFDYGTVLAQLDALVNVEKQAKTVSETS